MFCIEIIFLGVWMFLAWMVWKKKTVSRYLKALKTLLLIAGTAGIMLVIFIVGAMSYFGHSISSLEGVSKTAETVAFWIGFPLDGVFCLTTIGGLVIFLIEWTTTKRDTEISTI